MKRILFWKRSDPASTDAAAQADGTGEGTASLLTGDAAQDTQSLQILLDMIADVSSNLDFETVLGRIVDKSLEVTDAERAIVMLGDSAESLEIRLARTRDGDDLGNSVKYSRTYVRECFEKGQAVRAVVQSDQEAKALAQSVFNLKLRAMMCAPLRSRERSIGVIYVDSTAVRREFGLRDLALFDALSAQLAVAIENARLHADSLEKARLAKDVEIARRIQQHLLARLPSDLPGIGVAVRFAAADEASGDCYDFIRLVNGRLVVSVGDVTGHGVGAALLTHAAQSAVRSYFELIDDLPEVVRRLNERLVREVEPGNFLSFIALRIDPTEKKLDYVNCGHLELVRVRDGQVECFEKTGMVLGILEGQEYDAGGPIDPHLHVYSRCGLLHNPKRRNKWHWHGFGADREIDKRSGCLCTIIFVRGYFERSKTIGFSARGV